MFTDNFSDQKIRDTAFSEQVVTPERFPNPIGPYGMPPASEYEGMWDGRGVNVPGKYEQAETDYWSDKQVINTPDGEIVIDSQGNVVTGLANGGLTTLFTRRG